MATTTIGDLSALTTPASGDLVLVEDVSASNASKKVTISDLAKGMQGTAVADANQTIAGPSIAEVQTLSDKVDELLAVLRAADLIAT